MPKQRPFVKDPDAYKRRSVPQPAGDASAAVRRVGVEEVLGDEQTPTRTASQALKRLAAYDEGWLRVVSHDYGAKVFLKFKFTRGPFANKYVMYVVDDYDLTKGLWGLHDKVEACYEGTYKPTEDTFFS